MDQKHICIKFSNKLFGFLKGFSSPALSRLVILLGFMQGHCRPGEVQQHHIGLLQKCQGNSASLWHHKAGDLWRPAQVDENDRQGKQTVTLMEFFGPLCLLLKSGYVKSGVSVSCVFLLILCARHVRRWVTTPPFSLEQLQNSSLNSALHLNVT